MDSLLLDCVQFSKFSIEYIFLSSVLMVYHRRVHNKFKALSYKYIKLRWYLTVLNNLKLFKNIFFQNHPWISFRPVLNWINDKHLLPRVFKNSLHHYKLAARTIAEAKLGCDVWEILLVACQRFAIARISDNRPGRKQG